MLEMEALQSDRLFLAPFMPKRIKMALPVPTNYRWAQMQSCCLHLFSTDKPRRSHAVSTLWAYLPTFPYPALSAEAEPNFKGSDIMKLKV